MAWIARFALYLAGLAAGFFVLIGLADFDTGTWMLDIHPFNLREFVLSLVATVSSGTAAVATWKGWHRK